MFSRYSLASIFHGQVSSICGNDTGINRQLGVTLFFGLPLFSPLVQWSLGLHLDKDIISIIISAASIFAGLLLNLLVIVYGIAPEPDLKLNDRKTYDDLQGVIEQAFYNISYAIVVSGALVVCSLIFLTNLGQIVRLSELVLYYLGLHLLLCVVLVLKRCHSLIEFRLTKRGSLRAAAAASAWGGDAKSSSSHASGK